MQKFAKNLPQAPDGCRWATMSRKGENGEWTFEVKAKDKTVCTLKGHIVVPIPLTRKAALTVLDTGKARTYFDPTAGDDGEEFEVKGMISRAAELVKHDAESGRGAIRVGSTKGLSYTLEQAQAEVLGTSKRSLTRAEVEAAFAKSTDAGMALLAAHGVKITDLVD